jgi:hypothetical protein
MLIISCDICGKEIEKFDINEDFQIMKYKSRGRICCEGCEEVWNAYEDEVSEAEARYKESLEEKLAKIKEKYFKDYSSPPRKEEERAGRVEEDKTSPPKGGFSHFKLR